VVKEMSYRQAMQSHRMGIIGSKLGTPSSHLPLPRFRRAGREGKSQSYLFVAAEGHDEDMDI
jgi:hypothetical protein